MKTLTLHVSEKAEARLKSAFTVRAISAGVYGVTDEFVNRIIVALNENKKELNLELKEEREKRNEVENCNIKPGEDGLGKTPLKGVIK